MHDIVEKRMSRARTEQFEHYVKHSDPTVIEVETESESTYTIVPNVAYCSCPDRQYRHNPCKHLCYLATDSDVASDVAQSVVSGFRHHVDTVIDLLANDDADVDDVEIWLDAWRSADQVADPDETAREHVPEHSGMAHVFEPKSSSSEPDNDVIARIASTAE